MMGRSHAVVGFWLMHCLRRPQEMVAEPLRDLFARVASGELKVVEGDGLRALGGAPGTRGPAGAAHHGQARARSQRLTS